VEGLPMAKKKLKKGKTLKKTKSLAVNAYLYVD
jgi:hypothetical protein